jgi:hypothetical protein
VQCNKIYKEKTNRGKGIGTKVLKEALKIGFKDVKFEKINGKQLKGLEISKPFSL